MQLQCSLSSIIFSQSGVSYCCFCVELRFFRGLSLWPRLGWVWFGLLSFICLLLVDYYKTKESVMLRTGFGTFINVYVQILIYYHVGSFCDRLSVYLLIFFFISPIGMLVIVGIFR